MRTVTTDGYGWTRMIHVLGHPWEGDASDAAEVVRVSGRGRPRLRFRGCFLEPSPKSGGEPPHSIRFANPEAHRRRAQRLECVRFTGAFGFMGREQVRKKQGAIHEPRVFGRARLLPSRLRIVRDPAQPETPTGLGGPVPCAHERPSVHRQARQGQGDDDWAGASPYWVLVHWQLRPTGLMVALLHPCPSVSIRGCSPPRTS